MKCEICTSEFVPKIVRRGSSAQKYCSEKCRDKAYDRRLSADPTRRARRNEKERARLAANPAYRDSKRRALKKYQTNHPERVRAFRGRWCANNRERLANYQRLRRSKDPEKYRQQQRDYYRRMRDAARRGVLATTPKKRGRPKGKRETGTETNIKVIAYCQVVGMSDYQIATYWWRVTGLMAAKTTIDSRITDHAIEIEHRKSFLLGLSEPEREKESGLSDSQRKVVKEMAAARRKR